MVRVLAQSLAIFLLILLLVANFLVVKSTEAVTLLYKKICRQWRYREEIEDRMLHYCLAHLVYHSSRHVPKRSRAKFEILVLFLVTVLLFPQIFVLLRPKSSRFCNQPLLVNLTSFIILTFIMTGFTVLLTLMDPIPNEVKVAFHVYGVGSFAQGITTTAFTVAAPQCVNTTPELYYLSFVLSVLSVLATVFIGLLVPFWLADIFCSRMVLTQRSRDGVCQKQVANYSYMWHV